MEAKMRIGIVGATGYVGMELVRILSVHPGFVLTQLVSRSHAGQRLSDIYPSFSRVVDLELQPLDLDRLAADCDLVITALPHGVSSEIVPQLLDRDLRVIDHSGDFRYRDAAVYEGAYKLKHPRPDLLAEAIYGLPELYRREIAGARLVANPGCYPTCSLLALLPLLKNNLIRLDSIIIDAVSGVSGAGRKSDTAYSFCETAEGFRAYGVVGHRHTTEIEQECGFLAGLGRPQAVTFTPHLAPMKRGMLATVYADLLPGQDPDRLMEAYREAYAEEWFIRLLSSGQLPDTRLVTGTNFADVSVHYDKRTGKVKALCAIDNLGKGAAAQAVQAMNLMAGLAENEGLIAVGMAI
ncbi:MAG: N-acetyl-gamma-glutamyl-phosphate reductase [Eubacteriales bacterium]|nr:N-acetyl-gamma-glutamyl-phosphate reductase [Eubacteriales bacterium]MDD4745302.1 N-acetyl-gamma-glutamyl-phosphate reductase [Eubacteriales bacterium]